MNGRELDFIKQKFREYYASRAEPPSDLESREFGYGWSDKIEFRHKCFANPEEFKRFLVTEAPFFVSCSAAHYAFPAARPMERKQLREWDLIFDLDAPSKKTPHEHDEVFCRTCFEAVRGDAVRLCEEFLEKDFGFARNEIAVNFSGRKGFHVRLESRAALELGKEARKQLVDYAQGPSPEGFRFPEASAKGWGAKIFSKCYSFIEKASADEIKEFGLRKDRAARIIEMKRTVLEKMREGVWDSVAGIEKVWARLVPETIAEHAVAVDKAVSFDESKLVRVPNSLHGDSSLIAKKIPLNELNEFDPLKNAVAFAGEQEIRIKSEKTFSFDFLGERTEVSEGENELREGAALFLLCARKVSLA